MTGGIPKGFIHALLLQCYKASNVLNEKLCHTLLPLLKVKGKGQGFQLNLTDGMYMNMQLKVWTAAKGREMLYNTE